jgi:C4-type Zn-finger protein
MKRTLGFLFGAAVVLLAIASSSLAQEKQVTLDRKVSADEVSAGLGVAIQGPETMGGNTWTFVTSEMSFDRLVKGAPYSAQAVTETTQVLSDGNRIVNSNSASVYRDGEGRTRREQALRAIGNFSPSGEPFTTISINDPVAGVSYVLEPQSRTARKVGGFRIESGAGEKKINSINGDAQVFIFKRPANGEAQTKPGAGEIKMRMERDRNGRWRSEELGTQIVEGVNAVGTRTTITIPAGQIGNERAIEIVDERWFSPELKALVMTRHTDPRAGETVYRLTNINRVEPDHSLFEVPGDYTLREDVEPMKSLLEKQTKPELN